MRTLILTACLLISGAALSAGEDKKDADGFTPLFNGKDLTGLKTFLPNKNADPAKTWIVKDGEIHCTGQPNGFFCTDKSYKNYILRYDWKYIKAPTGKKSSYNSGALIHMQDYKIWPKCVEVQGANANHGILYFLGVDKIEAKYDQKLKDKVTKPIGDWNSTEIMCTDDGTITAKINGTEVSSGKSDLTEGPIGWQSEGAEIHFRNIKIKKLN